MNKTEKKYYLHYLGFTSKGFVPKVSTPYNTKSEATRVQKSMIKSLKIKSIINNNKFKETIHKDAISAFIEIQAERLTLFKQNINRHYKFIIQ